MQEVLSIGRSNPRLLRARLDIFILSYFIAPLALHPGEYNGYSRLPW